MYAASGPEQDAAAVPDYVRFLTAGVNVVTVSSWGLILPPSYEPSWRARSGRRPTRWRVPVRVRDRTRFAADQLPLLLMTQSNSIRSIRASEFPLYDAYPVEFMMKEVMGFGRPLDHAPLLGRPGAPLGGGPPVRYVASRGWGVELDDIRETYERRVTDRTLEVVCGVIEAGTCGAHPDGDDRRDRRGATPSSSSTSTAWHPTSHRTGPTGPRVMAPTAS